MIQFRVSAVCRVRDGFTGRLIEGKDLRCALDGTLVRPVCKPGGYLVLTDLSEGPHRLSLRCSGFREELTDFSVGGLPQKLYLSLKPSEQYVFHQEAVRLKLRLLEGSRPAADRTLWLTVPTAAECKVAQDAAAAGAEQLRLFCGGAADRLPVPGMFLIEDGADSEIVSLLSVEAETGSLAAPLQYRHRRSKCLLPAQQFRTGGDGAFTAVFRTAGTVLVFVDGRGLADRLELKESPTEKTVSL
jgi:hypothetical protein